MQKYSVKQRIEIEFFTKGEGLDNSEEFISEFILFCF